MNNFNMKHAFIYYSSSTPNVLNEKMLSPKFKYVQKKIFVHPKPIFTNRELYKSYTIKNINTINKNAFYLKKKKLPNICNEIHKTSKTNQHKYNLPSICISKQNSRNIIQQPIHDIKLTRNKTINVYKHIFEMKSLTKAIGNKFLKEVLENNNI